MSARPWVPPAAFNFIATLIAFGAAIGLAWMAWNYYEYAPWTRDGRVRVYTVQVAPEVSGTVVALPIKGTQFVHKGDVLFQIDPRGYENKVRQAIGVLARAQAQESYLRPNCRTSRYQLNSGRTPRASHSPPKMRWRKQPVPSIRRGSTWNALRFVHP
jgi:multidrug resistance efflux pump